MYCYESLSYNSNLWNWKTKTWNIFSCHVTTTFWGCPVVLFWIVLKMPRQSNTCCYLLCYLKWPWNFPPPGISNFLEKMLLMMMVFWTSVFFCLCDPLLQLLLEAWSNNFCTDHLSTSKKNGMKILKRRESVLLWKWYTLKLILIVFVSELCNCMSNITQPFFLFKR